MSVSVSFSGRTYVLPTQPGEKVFPDLPDFLVAVTSSVKKGPTGPTAATGPTGNMPTGPTGAVGATGPTGA